MKRPNHIAVLAVLALLVACGDETPAARPATTKPKPKVEKAADALTAGPVDSTFVYQYNPVAKRDPFRPPMRELGGSINQQCSEPLCQFELDQLKLVGVVTGIANPFGMVEDPQGRGYIVRRNTRMGRQGGKVTQILRDSITVTEYWTAPDGKQNPNPVSMQLAPDKVRSPEVDLNTGKTF